MSLHSVDLPMKNVYIVNGFAGSAEFNGICNTYGIDAGIVDTDRKRDRNP